MSDNNFSIAGSLIHRIRHSCEFSPEGCPVTAPLTKIYQHELECRYRTLLCVYCRKHVSILNFGLADHSSRCFAVYDVEKGVAVSWSTVTSQQNTVGTIVLSSDGHRFYVHFRRVADEQRSIFYTAMEGDEEVRKKYKIKYVLQRPGSENMEVVTLSDVVAVDVMFDVDRVVELGSYGSVTDEVMKAFCHELENRDKKFTLNIAVEKW